MAWRRPLKLALLWGVGLALILAAALVAVIQLALPWWASDADRVARVLSSRLNTPVTIERTVPEWSPRGPLIELHGVRFGAAADGGSAAIDRAQWAIDFSGLLWPSRRFSEFRLEGLAITLERQDDGRWEVLGLPEMLGGGGDRPIGRVLRAVPAFVLRDSTLTVRMSPDLPGQTLELRELRRIDDARWRGRVAPSTTDDAAGELLLALDLPGDDSGGGIAYLTGRSLALAPWLGGFDTLDAAPGAGVVDLEAWLRFDDTGVADAQLELSATASTWRLSRRAGTAAASAGIEGGVSGAGADANAEEGSAAADLAGVRRAVTLDEVQAAGAPFPSGNDVDAADALALPPLRFDARWQRHDEGARLRVQDIVFGDAAAGDLPAVGQQRGGASGSATDDASAHAGGDEPPPRRGVPGSIAADFDDARTLLQLHDVPLAPLAALAQLSGRLPAGVDTWVSAAHPEGDVVAADLTFDGSGVRQLALRAEDLAAEPAPGTPGIRELSLSVRADDEGLVAWPSGDLTVDWPGVFVAPVAFTPDGAIAAWRDETRAWTIGLEGFGARGEGFSVQLAGEVRLPHGDDADVELDLGAHVADTQIEAVKPFWPINRMRRTAPWLNRSLDGGRIIAADAWIRGPARSFPFRHHDGRFEAVAEVTDAGLAYHPDWPALSGTDATLVFIGNSMQIEATRVVAAGLAVEDARARIDDLKVPILHVDAAARGTGEQLMAFLHQTPIATRYGTQIEGMAIHGSPQVEVDLTLPLKRELGEAVVDGRVRFAGDRFTDARRELELGNLDGELRFDRRGLQVDAMALTLSGEPARLDLRIGAATRDSAAGLEAMLTGHMSAGALFGRIEPLAPVVRAAEGFADWRVSVHVPDSGAYELPAGPGSIVANGGGDGGYVRVESDLQGIALALPAPLTKDRDTTLPLALTTGIAAAGRRVELQLGSMLQVDARLPEPGRPLAGVVALGGAGPERMPGAGLVITGQVPALDLSGWLALAGGDGGDGGGDDDSVRAESAAPTAWPQVALRAGELGVLGRAFREVDLQMTPDAEGVAVRLKGPDIEGTITWPLVSRDRVVRGRFQRLHVPGAEPGAEATATGGDTGDLLPPTAIPGLDIEAEDLRVGVSRLGRTALVAKPEGDRYRVERFTSRSPALALDASGDWRRIGGVDESDFDIELRADDLGAMLESFGFAGLITGGATRATIDGRWRGSPAAFALDRLAGTLDIEVGAGRILDVDPGVGRLFGLLNLREIPRRLILDFRDIFSQGMRFHSIAGRFTLETGQAYTDDMLLKSPSADILIVGRTGLASRDYDQTLEVTPRMGGTLPVVGAIAGGPAGAAAGLVVQGLFRIDEASRIVYRVTGPWDEPVIIKQEPGRESARTRTEPNRMEPTT